MTAPITTGLYAGLLGLLLIVLSMRVVQNRWRAKVGLGHGGDKALRKAIRIHGNFIEYVPLALLLMALIEMNGAQPPWLHGLGGALLAGP